MKPEHILGNADFKDLNFNGRMEVRAGDHELSRENKSYVAFVHEDVIGGLRKRISDWPRLKRIISLVLCFKKNILDCIRGNRCPKELDHTKQHCSNHSIWKE